MDNNTLEFDNIKRLAIVTKKQLYFGFKRIMDIVFSLIGIILLLPMTIIVKIIYMLNKDFAPVIYEQKRIGKNGKEFVMYKFRTMVPNADRLLKKLLKEPKTRKEWYENHKLENDPRITKVGKVLRNTSLDEFPQFLNIFIGNMSLIGNRPYMVNERKEMNKYFSDIVKTKPGITGYWQTNGRNDIEFNKRLELEQNYSLNCGLKMDLQIFFKTFKVVLFRKGAK